MDGTLIDSEPLWDIANYEMSELIGRRLTPECMAQTAGMSFEETLALCADYAGITLTQDQHQHYWEWTAKRMATLLAGIQPNPGVTQLLTELKNNNIPMMVVTNTRRAIADASIDAVGRDFFNGSICGDEVTHSKPAPEIYEKAAAYLGVDTQHCLAFEDSKPGMQAALLAGCQVIGLPTGGKVPPGVTDLADLNGSRSFEGVSAADLEQWFEVITTKVEE